MDYLKTIEYRVKPVSALKIIRNCSGCGKKTTYVSTNQFRVNANGNLVDIWLVYQYEKIEGTPEDGGKSKNNDLYEKNTRLLIFPTG